MASQKTAKALFNWPMLVTEVEVTMDSGTGADTLDVVHGGPSGVAPTMVLHELTNVVAAANYITVAHTADDTTNNDSTITFEGAANMDDSVVKLFFVFAPQGSGGIG